MFIIFHPEVSLHFWLLWPMVGHTGLLPPHPTFSSFGLPTNDVLLGEN